MDKMPQKITEHAVLQMNEGQIFGLSVDLDRAVDDAGRLIFWERFTSGGAQAFLERKRNMHRSLHGENYTQIWRELKEEFGPVFVENTRRAKMWIAHAWQSSTHRLQERNVRRVEAWRHRLR